MKRRLQRMGDNANGLLRIDEKFVSAKQPVTAHVAKL